MTMFMFEEFRRAAFPYRSATLSNLHDWYLIDRLKEMVSALGEVSAGRANAAAAYLAQNSCADEPSPYRRMCLCRRIISMCGGKGNPPRSTPSSFTTSRFLEAWSVSLLLSP